MEFRYVYIHVSKKRKVNFSQCFNTYLSLECDFKFSNSATQCSYFIPVLVGFLSYTFFIGLGMCVDGLPFRIFIELHHLPRTTNT